MTKVIQLVRQVAAFVFKDHGGLTAVLVISLFVRLKVLQWWDTFPYGDVFNFVNIAVQLGDGYYPVDEKRLPFYPLLILIFHSIAPWFRWEHVAIGVALAASLASIVLLYAIGRTFRLSKTALVVGLFLFTSFQPFLHFSIRGYADTTSVALLLAGILATLHIKRRHMFVVLPFILGASALTRYEGAAAAAALYLLAIWRLRGQWKKIVIMTLLAAVTLLPYVWVAQRSGRSLLPQGYLVQAAEEGPDEYGAVSLNEWWGKYVSIWQRVGLLSIWYVPRNLYQTLRDDPLGFHDQLVSTVANPKSATGILATIGIIFLFLRRRLGDITTLAIPFAVISIPVAWWAPFTRYDALIFPVMVVAASAALHAAVVALWRATRESVPWGMYVRYLAGGALLFVACFGWMIKATDQSVDMLKKTRFSSWSYYQALKDVEGLPGIIALARDDNYTAIYLGKRAVYGQGIFRNQPDPSQRWQTLREQKTAYILDREGEQSPFKFLADEPYASQAEVIKQYKVEQGDGDEDIATVYKLHFE